MKKLLFGIFAHPDDEGFGPSGSLIHAVNEGVEVHLVLLTPGDAGSNLDNYPVLGDVRLNEWRQSAKIMGIPQQNLHFLGYKDGTLNNQSILRAIETIETLIRQIIENEKDTSLDIMSFELGGISGHIDHIVAGRTASAVFYRLKQSGVNTHELLLVGLPESYMPKLDVSWIFMDKGYPEDQLRRVDVSDTRKQKLDIVAAHHSQRSDGVMHRQRIEQSERLFDYFLVRN